MAWVFGLGEKYRERRSGWYAGYRPGLDSRSRNEMGPHQSPDYSERKDFQVGERINFAHVGAGHQLAFARPGALLFEPRLHGQGFASDLIQSLNTSNSGEWALFFGYTR
jgi:hypothetical protein